ncbi:MAG: efflux RND transporter periplasmic adaptor subunit [Pseudomonadaceae bacterium]
MNKALNFLIGILLASASLVAIPAIGQTQSDHAQENGSHRHSTQEESTETEHADEEHEVEEAGHSEVTENDHEDGHDGHDDHGAEEQGHGSSHDGHEEEEEAPLILSLDLLGEFGAEIAVADAGLIHQQVSLPGEVQLNKEAVTQVSPRFAAKIVDVRAKIGDQVRAGQTLAVAESSETLARFNLQSLIDGVVINREVTLGEHLSPSDTAFVVADMSTLWADIALYPKQVAMVEAGQAVRLSTGYGPKPVDAKIGYVAPTVDERTRTGLARVFLKNDSLAWKPGMFVQSDITIGKHSVEVAVPKSAIIDLEGQPTVFVKEGERWEPRPVKLGRDDGKQVEILAGLERGETYVADGGFVLKAQLQKNEFESGHNH